MKVEPSLKKRIALNLFRKYRQNSKKIHDLTYLFWECTLRCNLNCLHCGSDCQKDTSFKDMPVSDFIAAIDDITPIINPNKTMIVITGGEPLLRNDLEECGRQLNQRGFPWGFVSNGYNLTKERLTKLLQAGLHAVTISLDGFEQSHNWLRGRKDSFEKAVKSIQLLASLDNFKFDVVTCVNQRNFKELPQIKELLLKAGVKEWRIFSINPIGRAKLYDELHLPPKQFKELVDFIVAERKKGDILLNYGCEGYFGNYEGKVRDGLFFCQAGINVASVLVDGSLSACPILRENFIQGNIYKDSFKQIWTEKYDIMRNRKWTKTGKCATCDQFKYCEGNGLHLRDEKSGELMFCHYNELKEAEKTYI